MMVVTAASVLLAILQGVVLFCLSYQYMLALASIRQRTPPVPTAPAATRFAIAIPAHNEASVLAATLAQLQFQEYPRQLFDIHVVADHCDDNTAEVAQRGGATVHVRQDHPKGRKAYALQWLFERLVHEHAAYDAVVVFDADSIVDPSFLRIMDGHLRAGRPVLQGQHVISNPEDSRLAAIAAVDMRLNNRLRNQSRSNLGLSCRLMGDAMVFDIDVLRAYGWPAQSMIEDREYGYELLLKGIRVYYVPEAKSFGQAAGSWKQAEPQRLRWYRGVVEIQQRLAGRLVDGAIRRKSLVVLDAALELLIPSYSFLAIVSVINLGLTAALNTLMPSATGPLGLLGSALLFTAWVLYPVLGLLIDRAPAAAFRALLFGPAYLIWRLWISVLVRLRGDRVVWARTKRRQEIERVR